MKRSPFLAPLQRAIRDRFLHPESDRFSGPRIYLENAGGSLKLKAALEADQRIAGLPDNAGRDNLSSREIDRILRTLHAILPAR